MPATKPKSFLVASGVGQIVAANPSASADAVVKSIFQAVAEHASEEEAFEDQTVVAIRVKGTPGKRK
jgi:serine phosphatase RsbU (regulator of sigma subunit)